MISRRAFLGRSVAFVGLAVGTRPGAATGAETPPETTRIRLARTPNLCQAPQYIAEALLEAEGFREIEYVKVSGGQEALAPGLADVSLVFSGPLIILQETGAPIVFLAGGHVGCFELIGRDRVRAVRDLKGKTVAIRALGATEHVFLSSMLAHVGLDPRKDVTWVFHPAAESARRLQAREIDAFMAFPPFAQQLRTQNVGHVVVNSAVDRPWSQYFCCMWAAHRDFVKRYPVATKRALRALLKATDVCALEPERAARAVVDKGFTESYALAVQMMRELPYVKWRDYDAEDTIRFYALRLHEAGMIRTHPKKILAEGTDWRFVNELKRELKG